MKKQIKIRIFGKVQGVFFRISSKKKADSLGLFGYVKNIDDGSVEIEAVGEEKKLSSFLEWCKKGPEGAKIERIDYSFFNNISEFESFEILK